MALKLFQFRQKEECEVHGHHHHKSGNRMLAAMMLISLGLIVWHVRVHGPTGHAAALAGQPDSLPFMVLEEIRDLLFNKKGVLAELWEVFPYFLAGILIAGYLRTYKVANKLQMKLRKYGVASVFLASLVGIITPLCACGTLTTAISLLFAGIPLAPVMALMVTSPLLSPSTYLITLNDLGPEWTVIRTVSAYAMGIFAGLITHYVSKRPGFGRSDIFIEGGIVRGDFHDDDYPDERLRCNCRRNFGNRVAVRTSNRFVIFLAKSSEMIWTVGKYVIVGVVIGAIIERYMPSEWIYGFFGRKGALSIVWVTLASVPMFLHQISASSVLAHIKSSLNGTLDNGAALAFMIGGPVTAVPTMVMFWTFFKKRVFALYMFVCLSGTMLIAYSFQLLFFTPGVDLGNPLLKGVGTLSGGYSAVIVKKDPNVRMVMDPAGKGVIATYSNDLDGKGPVVFDSSPGRFMANALICYDNLAYMDNIAGWLEQSVSGSAGKRILVYALADAARPGDALRTELSRKGYEIKVVTRKAGRNLAASDLEESGQVWLFHAPGKEAALTEAEVKLLTGYNARGKGMLLVAAPAGAGEDGERQENLLAERFGVIFNNGTSAEGRVHVSVASNLLNRASELLGQALKMVNKA